jgi:aerobic carbon-monoxide dehydrogenase small subunit
MSVTVDISFKLNGVEKSLRVPATMSALDMLRDVIGLTGAKYGCGEGECGACTISVDGTTVNSCLMFAADCDGRELVTIEGLASDPLGAKVEASFVAHGAVQCGFCTPGFVMQSHHVLEKNPDASVDEIRRGVEGNLCRCTGYKKIVEAVSAAGGAN